MPINTHVRKGVNNDNNVMWNRLVSRFPHSTFISEFNIGEDCMTHELSISFELPCDSRTWPRVPSWRSTWHRSRRLIWMLMSFCFYKANSHYCCAVRPRVIHNRSIQWIPGVLVTCLHRHPGDVHCFAIQSVLQMVVHPPWKTWYRRQRPGTTCCKKSKKNTENVFIWQCLFLDLELRMVLLRHNNVMGTVTPK